MTPDADARTRQRPPVGGRCGLKPMTRTARDAGTGSALGGPDGANADYLP